MSPAQDNGSARSLAIERVVTYLLSREDTFAVSRCEEDDIYGDYTCDLVWFYVGKDGKQLPIKVLVEGDRFDTGTFVFETTADAETMESGRFLNTTATYFFYYFLSTSDLYIIPVATVRDWFMMNIDNFEHRRVAVKTSQGYRTRLTRLVPIDDVANFPRVQKLTI